MAENIWKNDWKFQVKVARFLLRDGNRVEPRFPQRDWSLAPHRPQGQQIQRWQRSRNESSQTSARSFFPSRAHGTSSCQDRWSQLGLNREAIRKGTSKRAERLTLGDGLAYRRHHSRTHLLDAPPSFNWTVGFVIVLTAKVQDGTAEDLGVMSISLKDVVKPQLGSGRTPGCWHSESGRRRWLPPLAVGDNSVCFSMPWSTPTSGTESAIAASSTPMSLAASPPPPAWVTAG